MSYQKHLFGSMRRIIHLFMAGFFLLPALYQTKTVLVYSSISLALLYAICIIYNIIKPQTIFTWKFIYTDWEQRNAQLETRFRDAGAAEYDYVSIGIVFAIILCNNTVLPNGFRDIYFYLLASCVIINMTISLFLLKNAKP